MSQGPCTLRRKALTLHVSSPWHWTSQGPGNGRLKALVLDVARPWHWRRIGKAYYSQRVMVQQFDKELKHHNKMDFSECCMYPQKWVEFIFISLSQGGEIKLLQLSYKLLYVVSERSLEVIGRLRSIMNIL